MCSRAFRPLGSPIYVARVPAAPFSLLPSSLYLDHSHCPVLAPATLAALPSTRAIPGRDVFYVAHPIRSIRRGWCRLNHVDANSESSYWDGGADRNLTRSISKRSL